MITNLRNFLSENDAVKKLNNFYESTLYLLCVSFIILISYMLAIEVFGVCLCLLLLSVGLIVCKDLKPIIPLLLGFILIIPYRENFTEGATAYVEYVLGYLPYIIIFSSFLIVSIIFHFLLWGGFKATFTKPTKLILCSLPFSILICFNGLFNQNYSVNNLIFALVTVFCLVFLVSLFKNNLIYNQKTIDYFFKSCAFLAIVFICQYIFICLTRQVIVDGKILKFALNFGWGNPNNYGNFGCYLIPAIFYLAYKSQKSLHAILYYVLGILTYVFACISLSRNAILTGTLLLIFILVYLCLKGNNKKLFLKLTITTIVVFILLTVTYLIISQKFNILTKLFEDIILSGFSDNGRFELWGQAFNSFLSYPIFGQGFFACEFVSWTGFIPGMYHNTFFELLGTCGIFTLLAYGLYRYYTLKVVFYKLNTEKIFFGLIVFALIFSSLFDNFIFHIYPTFFYSIAIALCNLHYEKEKELEKSLLKN